ncbi:MAG: STAS domain-containing protein [Ferrovum sp.]|jgi:anti-anti-sigma regulatory factor|nr:STAS domain-containing protein [Ferrovum sp.]
MSICLPAYLTARSADECIVACQKLVIATTDVVVDACRLCFVDPFGMALLGATFHAIRQQGRAVQICGLGAEMAGYLKRMDMFEGVELVDCAPIQTQRQNRGDSLVELTRLCARRDVDEASFRLAHAVAGHIPGVNPDEPPDEMTGYTAFERLVEPVQYALSELLENALTHARGRLVIVSGDAIHDTSGRSRPLTGDAFWQGVAIAMECRRDRLPVIRFRDLLPPLDAQPARRLRFE